MKRRVALALGAALVCTACRSRGGLRDSQGRPDAPRIFASYCAPCHGPDGRRELPGGKRLTDAADWPLARIRTTIARGQGTVMPAWGGVLEPDQLDAVTLYAKRLAAAGR